MWERILLTVTLRVRICCTRTRSFSVFALGDSVHIIVLWGIRNTPPKTYLNISGINSRDIRYKAIRCERSDSWVFGPRRNIHLPLQPVCVLHSALPSLCSVLALFPRIEIPGRPIHPTDIHIRKKLDPHLTPHARLPASHIDTRVHYCIRHQVYMYLHTVHDTILQQQLLLFPPRIEIRPGIVECSMTPGSALAQPTCWSYCFAQNHACMLYTRYCYRYSSTTVTTSVLSSS